MYAHFYQLSESPFNLTPDPKFHYINESTREALAAMLYGIKARKGFITLIAEAGTGKTTLLKRIVDEIEGETRVVFVFNPGVSFEELLEFICAELGIATDGRRLNLLDRLNQFLLDRLEEGLNVVVMIDEAQTLSDSVLEELRLLSNLETSKEKILQIVLSGQPELEEKLRRPGLRQLRQRIGVRATLKPMRADEMRAYVETRLRGAGSERSDLFTQTALRKVWRASQGIPRVINVVCDNAMMIAFAEGKNRITASVTAAAVRDLEGQSRGAQVLASFKEWLAAPTARYSLAGLAILTVGAAALWALPGAEVLERRTPAIVRAPRSEPAATESKEGRSDKWAKRGGRVQAAGSGAVQPGRGRPHGAGGRSAWKAERPSAGQENGSVRGLHDMPLALSGLSEPVVGARDENVERVMADSIRRAELQAGSTAARLFQGRSGEGSAGSAETAEVGPAGMDSEEPPRVAMRPVEDAEVMVAEVFLRAATDFGETELVGPPEPPGLAVLDPPGEAEATEVGGLDEADPFAAELESLAGFSAEGVVASLGEAPLVAPPPLSPGQPVIGRFVRVAKGDTVWAIALQYFGAVDSAILTQIFLNNAGIIDPRRLEVGDYVYLPFLSPEQMVKAEGDGTYSVLLVESPDRAPVEQAAEWVRAAFPGVEMRDVTVGRSTPVRMLYSVGFASKSHAVEGARDILAHFTGHRGGQPRGNALVGRPGSG